MLNMKYISVALCAYSEVEKKSNNGDDSSTEGTRGGVVHMQLETVFRCILKAAVVCIFNICYL